MQRYFRAVLRDGQPVITRPINGQGAHDIVNACSLAFFDRHLLDQAAGPVHFESRPP
jgi:hypothetical protein